MDFKRLAVLALKADGCVYTLAIFFCHLALLHKLQKGNLLNILSSYIVHVLSGEHLESVRKVTLYFVNFSYLL